MMVTDYGSSYGDHEEDNRMISIVQSFTILSDVRVIVGSNLIKIPSKSHPPNVVFHDKSHQSIKHKYCVNKTPKFY